MSAGRKFGGDGLVGLEQPVAIDGELRMQAGNRHRIGDRAAVGDGAGQHRPEQAEDGEQDGDQPDDAAAE